MKKSCIMGCAALLFVALFVGCSVVREARETQDSLAAKGGGGDCAAQPLRLHDVSLEGLVKFALTNRPSIVAARLAVEDARLSLKALAADAPLASETPWTAPHLSLAGAYSEQSGGTLMKDHQFQTRGSASAGLSLDLLVWDFGRYDARAKAQAERVIAAERNLSGVGYSVFEDVATAYFLHLERRAHLDVSLTNASEYAAHLMRAQGKFAAGEAHQLDVLKAKLDLAQALETVVAASNLVATTGAQLMNALGIDASRGTCSQVLAGLSAQPGCVLRGFDDTHCDVDEAFAFARTNAPSMQVARARLRAASSDVDYAIADLMPKISASASFSWTDPLWFFKWGFSAAQDLFQGFRKTTAVEQARVALLSASTDVDEAEQQLSLNLETAVATRDDSRKAIDTAIASIRSARENLDMVRQQLDVGSVSRIELSEAISSFSSAVGSGITAFYNGQTAEAKLFRIVGRQPVYNERSQHISVR